MIHYPRSLTPGFQCQEVQILHIGKSDGDGERQAQWVNKDVSLAPLDVLVSIKPRSAPTALAQVVSKMLP